MAISEAMIAQAFLEYFQRHAEEFEEFLFERFNIDEGIVSWGEDKTNKKLLLTVSTYSQDGARKSEDDYIISIAEVKPSPEPE